MSQGCGCRVTQTGRAIVNTGATAYSVDIIFCPMHQAAPATRDQRDRLLEACKLALHAFEDNWAINWGELEAAIAAAEPVAAP